ncbi:MAG: sensor domain-containing diguanylate cyclase [Phycisphaerae bacterium]|nr:sensor domain-containing diguanylate cyclase [Phycisphaerae bacterium]
MDTELSPSQAAKLFHLDGEEIALLDEIRDVLLGASSRVLSRAFSRISMLAGGATLLGRQGHTTSDRRMRRWIYAALRPWDPNLRQPWLRHLAHACARRNVAPTYVASIFAAIEQAGQEVLREAWVAGDADRGGDLETALRVYQKRLAAERIGFLSVMCSETNRRRKKNEARLKRQVANRLRRVRSAVALNDDVTGEIDEQQVVRIMAQYVLDTFAPDLLVINLLQKDGVVDTPLVLEGGRVVSLHDDVHICRIHQDTQRCRACRTGQVFSVNDAAGSLISCPYRAWKQKTGGYCCVPLAGGTQMLGWMHLHRNAGRFEDEEIDVLAIYGQMVGTALSSLRLVTENRRQATTDPLTGVCNRRHFEEILKKENALMQRRGNAASVVMLDVDGFKHFNDEHGHETGDRILMAFANALQSTLRVTDEVARLGGDEFVVLLRDCDASKAEGVAQKIIRTAADTNVRVDATQWEHLRISAGVACCPHHAAALEDALLLADVALIRAKESGKNRYVVFDPSADTDRLNARGYHQGLRISC